jgi:hypothetical protein
MCKDAEKAWRCLFPDQGKCYSAIVDIFSVCNPNVIPDLPEYIDDADSLAKADKVVKDCMATALVRKYLVPLSKDKMDEYKVCTGMLPRQKPLNPNLQKAFEISKSNSLPHCASGTYFRNCFTVSEKECDDSITKHCQECSLKMESEGTSVKDDESSLQAAASKISECGFVAMKKEFEAKKKSKGKDCE